MTGTAQINLELFHGKYVNCTPISPIDGYHYSEDELTFCDLTLDERKRGIDFFTVAIRKPKEIS